MRLSVIGDEDTVVGFRFAGVEGTVVRDTEEASRALARAVERDEGLVIIPQQVAEMIRQDIDRLRFGAALPLIVEIPGPEGPGGGLPSLFRLIRQAVGVKF